MDKEAEPRGLWLAKWYPLLCETFDPLGNTFLALVRNQVTRKLMPTQHPASWYLQQLHPHIDDAWEPPRSPSVSRDSVLKRNVLSAQWNNRKRPYTPVAGLKEASMEKPHSVWLLIQHSAKSSNRDKGGFLGTGVGRCIGARSKSPYLRMYSTEWSLTSQGHQR